MSRRAFFVRERGLRGPVPAVYYDGIPSVGGKLQSFVTQNEIPDGTANAEAFPGDPESPSFGNLERMFPLAVVA